MPDTAPNGLPFPLDTDPVADGAQALRNLVFQLCGIKTGRVDVDPGVGTADVVFDNPFPAGSVVNVQCTLTNSSAPNRWLVTNNASATGFTVVVQNINQQPGGGIVAWIASVAP